MSDDYIYTIGMPCMKVQRQKHSTRISCQKPQALINLLGEKPVICSDPENLNMWI